MTQHEVTGHAPRARVSRPRTPNLRKSVPRARNTLRRACSIGIVVPCLALPVGTSSSALLTDSATGSQVTVTTWSGCAVNRYRDSVLATGPESYLRMATPTTTETNTGVAGGVWTWTSSPNVVSGALGCDLNQAAAVTGSTWLSSEHLTFIAADSAAFSYSFWFKASPGSQGVLFSSTAGTLVSGASARGDRAVWLTPTGLLGVVMSDGPSTRWITSATAVTDDQWHFVVVTLQVTDIGAGRGTRLYLDGSQVAFGSQMRKGLVPATTESWRLGPATLSADLGALRPASVFAGAVDEVAVWAQTLSAAQVSSMWAARNG